MLDKRLSWQGGYFHTPQSAIVSQCDADYNYCNQCRCRNSADSNGDVGNKLSIE